MAAGFTHIHRAATAHDSDCDLRRKKAAESVSLHVLKQRETPREGMKDASRHLISVSATVDVFSEGSDCPPLHTASVFNKNKPFTRLDWTGRRTSGSECLEIKRRQSINYSI